MAESSTTVNQFRIRASRLIPQPIKANVHPSLVDDCVTEAWGNGWRDPDWLIGYALEGHLHASVKDPAAVFVARLREACATPCPAVYDATPTPPPPDRDALAREQARAAKDPSTWAERCRDAIRNSDGWKPDDDPEETR